jgi:hypothetical protein
LTHQLILGPGYITIKDKVFLFQVSGVKAFPMFKDTVVGLNVDTF